MPAHRSRIRLTVMLLLSLVLGGCGVRPEAAPTPIDVTRATGTPRPEPAAGRVVWEVYFLGGGRLAAVDRRVARPSLDTALALLVAGPTRDEVVSGIRTAVAPQSLLVGSVDGTDTAVIVATQRFAGVSAGNQLLAVAQVVWTVTELRGVTQVVITVDGEPVELPTDTGLSLGPVDRADYLSVAPTCEAHAESCT